MRSVKTRWPKTYGVTRQWRDLGVWVVVLLGGLWLTGWATVGRAEPASIQGVPTVGGRRAVVNFSELANREQLKPRPLPAPKSAPSPTPWIPKPTGAASPPPPPSSLLSLDWLVPPPPDSPSPQTGFLALPDNGTSIPPDTHGAVGPNHVMTTLNTQVRIQDRSGAVLRTVPLDTFWALVGSPSVFDPKVLYDPSQNRFVFTACANGQETNSAVLIGVSQTSDPTGNWYLFSIDADPTDTFWADYPSLGFNKDWVVVSLNMFGVFTPLFGGVNIYVFNKAALYNNQPAAGNPTLLQDNSGGGFTMTPAITYDDTLSTIYLVENENLVSDINGSAGRLRISTISGSVAGRPLAAKIRVTAAGSKALAPRP